MKTLNERGAAAVEFAIVLPLLVTLVFGMVEFSIALYDNAVVTNASREGARAGVVFKADPITGESRTLNESEIEAVINDYLTLGTPNSRLISFSGSSPPIADMVEVFTEELSGNPTKIDSGDYLSVRVTYPYGYLLLPNLISSIGPTINLRADTRMRVE